MADAGAGRDADRRDRGAVRRRLGRRRRRGHRRRAVTPAARFRFFGGKGGVGKTTTAAAAALAAAERGRRVLLVSTDPAHSLGDALDRRLSARPSRIATRRGALAAVELDADRALERWLAARRRPLRTIAARGTYLDEDDVDRLLALSLPGVDELIGLIELHRLATATPRDQVVVDTAPTGHTLRLLAMPDTLARIAGVLADMLAKHQFLGESLAGSHRRDAADALVTEIEGEARALHALLRDPARCRFTWVLLPEPLVLEETRDGVRALEDAGITVDEIVVNRVTPARGRCKLCAARAVVEHDVIGQLSGLFPGRRLVLLPALDREPRGTAPLLRVGAALARSGRAGGAPRPGRRDARATSLGAAPEWLDVLAPPGLDELFGILSLVDAVLGRERTAYDIVVLDTAPTGHALRLLAMPDAALEWVHALLAILLKYRAVVGLGELASDLLQVARDLRELAALLRDPARTRVVAVTRPAALPRLETARLVRGLRRLGIVVGAVLVNAVTPPGCDRCRRAAATERREITALAAAVRSAGGRRYAMISAPMEAPPPRGVASLARWLRRWRWDERPQGE